MQKVNFRLATTFITPQIFNKKPFITIFYLVLASKLSPLGPPGKEKC